MGTCTIQTDRPNMMTLKQRLKTAEIRKIPPYAIYQIRTRNCVITAYESGKLVFQGNGTEEYTALIVPSTIQETQSGTTVEEAQGQPKAIYPQVGDSEVGTSDYSGPVTVCVTRIRHEDMEFLHSLGIQDPRAVDDTTIWCMVPKLMERLPHSLLILNNVTYNRVHGENNMVTIKSCIHNQVYIHLRKKMGLLPQFCIVDQFVQKTSYYRCLKHEREVVYDIHFRTRAENKYLLAAAGSTIARHMLLKVFDAVCEQYGFTFLEDAGSKVDQNIHEFVAMHGEEALPQIAKLHSTDTKKALG